MSTQPDRLFKCCACCPDDTNHGDIPVNGHEVECPTCDRAPGARTLPAREDLAYQILLAQQGRLLAGIIRREQAQPWREALTAADAVLNYLAGPAAPKAAPDPADFGYVCSRSDLGPWAYV